MGKIHKPRAGSLQVWPRKRAAKALPGVNWRPLQLKNSDKKFLGFIGYKAGMLRIIARDLTQDSMTKNKKIVVPVTAVEVPPMKILSIRFYKKIDNRLKIITDFTASNLDKELKKKIKLSKKTETKSLDELEKRIDEFHDIRAVVYSLVKKTEKKKTPEIIELGLGGNVKEKFDFLKANLGKELSFKEFFEKGQLIDVRGLTKGYGLQGPVKRFGIGFRSHKAEKGRRNPGSLGPWHPARVTFRAPQAGQLGFFSRVHYNQKIVDIGRAEDFHKNILDLGHYGKIKTDYVLVKGSIQGPAKRSLILTFPLRETKKTKKQNYEVLSLEK